MNTNPLHPPMDRQELAARTEDPLPIEHQSLTRNKVESRAFNIRESNSYILFDIVRHPGVGTSQLGQPQETVQTWRFGEENNHLERVNEFARWYMFAIEQNGEGEPVCRNCGSGLDTHEDMFGFLWRCADCGAVGGKEEAIFDPVIGDPLGKRTDYEETVNGLWVPVGRNGN